MKRYTLSHILLFLVSIGGVPFALVTSTSVFASGPIGLLNLLDDKAKHYHVGNTVFGNNERDGIVNWNIDREVDRHISELSHFSSVVPLDAPPVLLKISKHWPAKRISRKHRATIVTAFRQMADRAGARFVLVLKPERRPALVTYEVATTDGYGLTTKCVVTKCKGWLLDNFSVSLFDVRTDQFTFARINHKFNMKEFLIGAPDDRSRIEGFEVTREEVKYLNSTHVNAAKDGVLGIMRERIESVLQDANK